MFDFENVFSIAYERAAANSVNYCIRNKYAERERKTLWSLLCYFLYCFIVFPINCPKCRDFLGICGFCWKSNIKKIYTYTVILAGHNWCVRLHVKWLFAEHKAHVTTSNLYTNFDVRCHCFCCLRETWQFFFFHICLPFTNWPIFFSVVRMNISGG